MRGLIRTGIGLGILSSAAIAALAAWPIGRPVALGMMTGDPTRGAYLARSGGCVTCHTNIADAGPALAGGAPLNTQFGSFVPPNITPDLVAGIGDWTLDQFAVAVRQGIRPDGKAYYPAFPYEFYAGFTDQEVADLWAAIRTVPAVDQAAAPHDVGFPFNLRWGLKIWRAAYMAPVEMSPLLGKSDAWNRGQQLAQGATHCAACHTGRNILGGLHADEAFAGNDNLPGGSAAPAIRAAVLRDAGWTPANLAYALRTGIMPDGDVLGGSMAEVVKDGTSFLTDDDRTAIAAFLLDSADGSQPPGDNAVTVPRDAPMDDMSGMVMD